MTELKLTQAAYRGIYGGARAVITAESLLPVVSAVAGEAFQVFLSDGTGAIRAAGEGVDVPADLPVMGAPLNLCAIILPEGQAPVARAWGSELLLAKSARKFDILLVDENETELGRKIGPFFIGVQNRMVNELAARASRLEGQTLYLRQASERLMLELTAAKRVIEGVGYSDLTVVAEAPLGAASAGPGAMVDCSAFSQILPADGLAVAGVGLYVRPAAKPASGALRVVVQRDVDRKLLAESTVPYGALVDGWNLIRFDQAVSDVFGDVRLLVEWHTAEGKGDAPALGLSDIRGNRFGADGDDTSLALRVFKSVCTPVLSAEAMTLLPPPDGLPMTLLPGQHASSLDFYGGKGRLDATRGDVGFDPYMHDPDAGWVQVHLASDGLAGVCYAGPVPSRFKSLSLSVSVPDHAGPDVAFHAFLCTSTDNLEARVGHVLSGGAPADVGFDYGTTSVLAGESGTLTIHPATVEAAGRGIVLVARTLTGRTGRGWCRWSRAEFLVPTETGVVRAAPALATGDAPDAVRKIVRAIKLPELGGMVQFIDGGERLADLTASLGFCPMIMDENGGYLQTHPLVDTLSGAVLPSLVAPGTHKIVAGAYTGHPDAPDFVYAMLLVRQDIADVSAAVKSVLDTAALADGDSLSGGSAQEGVLWYLLRLGAGREGRLELVFPDALEHVYHLVLAARPVEQAISFGWCRWTTLGIMGFEQTPKA
ncbi:MAG: hypothetical protein EP335_05060 [Alphaproteobacteria bacterium]|nr:MAG: hypothetical protein EP335_05060 [Alphaproteobacteria bacterium]